MHTREGDEAAAAKVDSRVWGSTKVNKTGSSGRVWFFTACIHYTTRVPLASRRFRSLDCICCELMNSDYTLCYSLTINMYHSHSVTSSYGIISVDINRINDNIV